MALIINPKAIEDLKKHSARKCNELLATLPVSVVSKIPAMSSDEIMFGQKEIDMSFIVKDFFRPEVLRLEFENFRLAGFISSDLKEALLIVTDNPYAHWTLSAALGISDSHPEYVKFEVPLNKTVTVHDHGYVDKRGNLVTLTPGEEKLFVTRARELVDKFLSEDIEIDLGKDWVYDGDKLTIADTSNMRQPVLSLNAGSGSFYETVCRIAEMKAGEWI